jgi:cold shock CspA family protein
MAAIDEKVVPGRRLGWIAHINRDKGFAFIRGTDGEEYFAHVKTFGQSLWDGLTEGMFVSFEAVDTIKGWRSARVKIATMEEGHDISQKKAAWEASAHESEDAKGNRAAGRETAHGAERPRRRWQGPDADEAGWRSGRRREGR